MQPCFPKRNISMQLAYMAARTDQGVQVHCEVTTNISTQLEGVEVPRLPPLPSTTHTCKPQARRQGGFLVARKPPFSAWSMYIVAGRVCGARKPRQSVGGRQKYGSERLVVA